MHKHTNSLKTVDECNKYLLLPARGVDCAVSFLVSTWWARWSSPGRWLRWRRQLGGSISYFFRAFYWTSREKKLSEMKYTVHKPVSFSWEWGWSPRLKNYEAMHSVTSVLGKGKRSRCWLHHPFFPALSFLGAPSSFRYLWQLLF